MDYLYRQEGYALIGAAMEVYNQMGPGFLEEVYQECLEIELRERNILFQSQPLLDLYYKGRKLEKYYKPDFYVFDCLVVEIKGIKALKNHDQAQLLNYLKGSQKSVGYLLNFGGPDELEIKRMIYTH
ncbi:MAG: GxxExxY protein [Acidobacteriota bacterium]|nr:GxxExxY protein [Acidobacteriota bacterium]